MSYCERYLIGAFIGFAYAQLSLLQELRDPSPQEVALVDWASGIYVSVCGDTSMDNVTTLFKTAFVEVLNRFCQNVTACQLQRSVIFNAGDVMILEGYPRREYNGVRVRFVVVLPGSGLSISEQKYPLLSKEVIFNVFSQNHYELENRMQMYIMEYERYPRFDSITEFMNTAVIPIGFLLIVVMFGLAYWTSTLTSSRNGNGSFMSGNYKDKYASEKRRSTVNLIDERKLEEGLQQTSAVENELKSTRTRFGFKKNSKKTNDDTKSEHQRVQPTAMDRNIAIINAQRLPDQCLAAAVNEMDFNEHGYLRNPNNNIAWSNRARPNGFSRRLSSFEEAFKERKRRKTRRSGGNSKRDMNNRWKSTSMALGGFRLVK